MRCLSSGGVSGTLRVAVTAGERVGSLTQGLAYAQRRATSDQGYHWRNVTHSLFPSGEVTVSIYLYVHLYSHLSSEGHLHRRKSHGQRCFLPL